MTDDYYDSLETRAPEAREGALFAALPAHVAHAKQHAPAYADILAGIDPQTIHSRKALATLPITRKAELLERQRVNPPFGGFSALALENAARVFLSPGPIYEPQGRREDFWRMGRALHAAGVRPGELLHNCFSYHFTPAGAMVESAAAAMGCPVFPAGIGQTELQIEAIATLRPVAYVGTPSFLKVLLDKAEVSRLDVSCLTKALVTGEALPPSLRAEIETRGVHVYQCYGTAELGLIAYETSALDGMVLDEQVILEIVRPDTGEPLPDGEVGEVVITALNSDYPLLRFATGDLSCVVPGRSACGRTNIRIKGWMGRADQSTKVKGMFVHPSQVAEVCRRHPEIGVARLRVESDNNYDSMTLLCEVAGAHDDSLRETITLTLRDVLKLRGAVQFVEPGGLPNDGIIIDDRRRYD